MAAVTTIVGKSYPRMEGRAKVTGRAEYTFNMRLPGMLFAKMCRAPISHGRIRAIDTSDAAAMPGVQVIVTGADVRNVIPDPFYGPAFHDQPILALDKVRHYGEPIAAVLGRRSSCRRSGRPGDPRRIRRTSDRLRRGRGDDLGCHRPRGTQACGHVCRSQASRRQTRHQHGAGLSLAPRRCG